MLFSYLLDFYNWNRVKVRYCDGGSFTGDGADAVSENHISMHGDRPFFILTIPQMNTYIFCDEMNMYIFFVMK
jgi:hypothetical protein